MALTGKQRRHLRALGHHLSAIVQVGHQGVTDGVIAATDQALSDHELVKLKISENAEATRDEAASALADATSSEVAQVLGRTMLLFRKRPKDSKIQLPR